MRKYILTALILISALSIICAESYTTNITRRNSADQHINHSPRDEELLPPRSLTATVEDSNNVILNWINPSYGELHMISYHDNNPDDGYYQNSAKGYGTVFDLSEFPGSEVEYLDFRHSPWGLNNTWNYKLHLVNWDTQEVILVIENLTTTGNDHWETDIYLNSIQSVESLGVFLQPLGNVPSDAYPVLDKDPQLDHYSYIININNYGIDELADGDFLMNLWVRLPSGRSVRVDSSHRSEKNGNLKQRTPENLLGYNIYRNNEILTSTENPNITTYTDENLDPGIYTYYVTAVYQEGESEPSNNVEVSITGEEVVIFFEDFETYENFALEFSPWITIDLDGMETYGFTNVSFPNEYDPMAFMIFNPSATSPPLTTVQPFSGNKMAASFAAVSGTNNDWLISPEITLGNSPLLRFWAKSQTAQWGLERLKVGVSTTTAQPDAFTFLHTENYLQIPAEWTLYEMPLTDYANQEIRLGFNCVSNDSFVLFIDHIEVVSSSCVTGEDVILTDKHPVLHENFPNPFNPSTTISFTLAENSKIVLDVFNLKGQKVVTLVDDYYSMGTHYVNWNGKDSLEKEVVSGIYFYRIRNGSFSNTKKMILMK